MKTLFYLLLLGTLLMGCDKYTEEVIEPSTCNFIDFYYYQDSTISLGELSNNYVVVAFDTNTTESEIKNFIAADKEFDPAYRYRLYSNKIAALKLKQSKSCEEITKLITTLQKSPIIDFVHYAMKTNDCTDNFGNNMGNLCVNSYSDHFYVKVKNTNDLTDLNKMIKLTGTELVEQYAFDPYWFILRANKNSKGDALRMANHFKESKLFVHSGPNPWKLPVE
jgi:hypothetical protein